MTYCDYRSVAKTHVLETMLHHSPACGRKTPSKSFCTGLVATVLALAGCADQGQLQAVVHDQAVIRAQSADTAARVVGVERASRQLADELARLRKVVSEINVCHKRTPSGVVVVPCSETAR